MQNRTPTPEEHEKLRKALAEAQSQIHALWQTLRTVAPECVVTEAQMEEVMNAPVPLENALADLDRLEGKGHAA